METRTTGSLEVVGLGINVPMQTTRRSESLIQNADVVFYNLSSTVAEAYVTSLNPNSHSLQRHYDEHPNRYRSYLAMQDKVMSAVAAGNRVTLALYGHPRVFADFPKWCVDATRELGGSAQFHGAVGADSCLIADLEFDPGNEGIQHYEATYLLMHELAVNVHSYLVLWQVSIAGDVTLKDLGRTCDQNIQYLVDKLLRLYPVDHQVCLYEAQVHALDHCRKEWIPLAELATAVLHDYTTLVIPPLAKPKLDMQVVEAMGLKPSQLGQW